VGEPRRRPSFQPRRLLLDDAEIGVALDIDRARQGSRAYNEESEVQYPTVIDDSGMQSAPVRSPFDAVAHAGDTGGRWADCRSGFTYGYLQFPLPLTALAFLALPFKLVDYPSGKHDSLSADALSKADTARATIDRRECDTKLVLHHGFSHFVAIARATRCGCTVVMASRTQT
jgi:hypothetical protein